MFVEFHHYVHTLIQVDNLNYKTMLIILPYMFVTFE